MKPDIDYTLYLCTDRNIMTTETIEESVELAIKGGVSVVQLREKECSSREFYEMAKAVKTITDAYEVPLLINDRIDIALAVGADGVHLGQSDLPLDAARNLLGADKIVGATANTVELAQKAWREGADYLGVGDVFGTTTKADTRHITLEELKEIKESVPIPIVAIGGIILLFCVKPVWTVQPLSLPLSDEKILRPQQKNLFQIFEEHNRHP